MRISIKYKNFSYNNNNNDGTVTLFLINMMNEDEVILDCFIEL